MSLTGFAFWVGEFFARLGFMIKVPDKKWDELWKETDAMNISGNNNVIQIGNNTCISGKNITTKGNKIFVDGKEVHQIGDGKVEIKVTGNLESISVENGDVLVSGDVTGDVKVGGNMKCHEVKGNVEVGGNLTSGDVIGNVNAGGNVKCGKVALNVTAGGNVQGTMK